MKWIAYIAFLLLLLQTSCKGQAPLSGKLHLEQNDQWSNQVYLIQPRNLDEVAATFVGQVIDSAQIKADGSFAFEKLPNTAEPILLELAVQKKSERFVNRLENENPTTDNYFPIVWQNGQHLKVKAAIQQFQSSFTIENPSPENAALLRLRNLRQTAFQQFIQENNAEKHDEAKLLEEEAAQLHFQQAIMDFAKQTDYLLPALVAIRWVSPKNDYERVPEFLVAQCEKWQALYPNHPWVMQLCNKTNRANLPVLTGDKIPDTSLPMLSGDTIPLYQLIKDKRLVILDLWASWCAPCRRENRNYLVPLWEKYHNQGFDIIGYALDASKNTWKKAIEADGAYRWVHASHLQGDDAPLLDALRIQTIPANFILDADGKVIAKNLHGEALTQFVESYLQ